MLNYDMTKYDLGLGHLHTCIYKSPRHRSCFDVMTIVDL